MIKAARNISVQNIFRMLILPLLLAGAAAVHAAPQMIAAQQVRAMLNEGSGLWLVDLRSAAAYRESHPEGALNIPFDELATRRLPPKKTIVLLDDSLGLRKGRNGVEMLVKKGFEKVYLLDDGIPAWQWQHLPMTGVSGKREFRRVSMDDISWARDNQIMVKTFDLRDAQERKDAPFQGATVIEGGDPAQQLARIGEQLTRTSAGDRPELAFPAPVIIIFSTQADPQALLTATSRFLPGDIRYLEGGQVVWSAMPAGKGTTKSPGVCTTCPGGGTTQ